MQNLLEIANLSVDFITQAGITSALEDICIKVKKGEIVAIVGESGSGKSVTSLSVLRLLQTPPAVYKSGNILFDDGSGQIDLLQYPARQMEHIRGNRIAMIFQEPMTSLNPVKTCGQQVAEALMLHKHLTGAEAKKATIDLFEEVKLPNPTEIFDRYPHQLSGGQKQRVMIAMAMSCKPALLICDEPTTALDVTVQKNILQLIKKLQQQNNMGVIFISHDLGVVAEIADKIVVMYKGKIVEQGNCNEVIKKPKHPYTKALLACRPALHNKNERLPVVSDFLTAQNTGDTAAVQQAAGKQKTPAASVVIDEPPTAEEPILKVEGLYVFYPAKKTFLGKITAYTKAVNNVSFTVKKGETLGLVGESGCGKTTLGRAVLGLLQPTAGNVIFKGTNLSQAGRTIWKRLRKDMQIIFQDPFSSLNPRKTVGAAIAEPLKVHKLFRTQKLQKEKAIELLVKTGLKPDHYNRYPHEFSGGQRQRIVIARALALEPSFIVCDESVSALDVSVQAQVLNLLNDLKKTFGFTAIFISHDLSVIRYMSDRIAVMHNGTIDEMGDTEAIYNNPGTSYTKKLIESMPVITT
ncbi:MAG TPA: ABC transporter ATP-binding protein [Chitinophagaceae bacterium]|nr:ABC transporter ATP-binding protein [Chitinophagaceae bacterium]